MWLISILCNFSSNGDQLVCPGHFLAPGNSLLSGLQADLILVKFLSVKRYQSQKEFVCVCVYTRVHPYMHVYSQEDLVL